MLVAFIDESYPDQKNKYCVSAVVLDMVALFDLSEGFRSVLSYANQAFNVDAQAELHGHEIMQQRKGWAPIRGKHRAATTIYKKALAEIAASGAKVFFEGVDVLALHQRYSYPDDPHEIALRHVLERVNDYAATRDRTVVVMADEEPGQNQHAAMIELFSRHGTPGYRSSRLPQILQPVRFDGSHHHAGLQAADLTAYLYNRMQAGQETHPAAIKARREMWDALRPAVHHARFWTP
ncbi:DUF3800 domain-containing protein [Paenarthrobacter ureafaciens]|uniref:DUF3800 domain-containing protein n=1 Tax=Paenarthrobacter ureafaciens TaxID=37931 RepID=UPI002DBF0E1A|nr:DUF3800 domain-containing protein [Paenarthrobacter ureafaciens]MEC3853455.1 DUF3800 domain-containing protein [Paenarthrobacter ureafaciens]